MKADELIARARSAIGHGTHYHLGAGGSNPKSPLPHNGQKECDCSGYFSWVIGLSRQTSHPFYQKFDGGWINTDAIYADALRATGFFTKIDHPIPGCGVVFPKGNGHNYGHVGVVTETIGLKSHSIVHCSPSNGDYTAIAENHAPAFAANPATIYFWYDGVEQ